jgi:mRNA-degrading endonuclease toxin of MazEF toxin-antitoxin module
VTQWEVYYFDFAAPIGVHPVVVISNNALCAKGKFVNVLKCVTVRGAREASVVEVLLNGADGLDHKSLCSCDVSYLVNKADLNKPLGKVTTARRRAIGRVMIALLGVF